MTKPKSTEKPALMVKKRSTTGKRRISRLRLDGLTPGVVYGRTMEPVPVVVNQRELAKLLHATTGEHPLVTLKLDDAKPWERPVLVQAIQHDPVSGHVLHIDFHAIVMTERLKGRVPLVLKGEPVGVKQDGGILEQFLREIEVECLPTEIPASVEFDAGALKIGDTVHVKDLTPPSNVKITTALENAVASVLMPKEEKPEEAAEAPSEPEVLREKKEEAEGAPGEGAKAEKPKAEKPDAKPDAKKEQKS